MEEKNKTTLNKNDNKDLKNVKTKEEIEKEIKSRLKELSEYLKNDGGDMEIIEINGKNVKLKLVGACGCCPHATVTLKEGIERDLRENIDPEIVVTREG